MITLKFRRRTWIMICIAALLLIGGVSLTVFLVARANAPQADFQYYAPTQLPAGFSIKDRLIDAMHEDSHDHTVNAYELDLRTEDGVYRIQEEKDFAGSDAQTTTKLADYDPKSIGITCMQRTSPAHTVYRLCHWADYGRISVYEVLFVKGGTFISTTFPTTLDHVVPLAELDRYVDSFQRGDTSGWRMVTGSIL